MAVRGREDRQGGSVRLLRDPGGRLGVLRWVCLCHTDSVPGVGGLAGHCGWGVRGLQVWPPGGGGRGVLAAPDGEQTGCGGKVALFLTGSVGRGAELWEELGQCDTHSFTHSSRCFPSPHRVPWHVLTTAVMQGHTADVLPVLTVHSCDGDR